MAETFKCSVCGKDVEFDGGLAVWASKNPDKVKCSECHANQAKGAKTQAKSVGNAKYTKATTKQKISAETFKKVFDEFKAEFADEMDEVKDYLGGWVSTVVINNSRG